MNESRRSQADVLGFGMELSDALSRYAAARVSDDPGVRAKGERLITEHYRDWFSRFPHVDNICFADITFFSPDLVSLRDALTIVFTPEVDGTENRDNYIRVLRDEYVRNGAGHTMAPHRVFAQGLPSICGMTPNLPAPEREADLLPFFAQVNRDRAQEAVTNGLFWAKFMPSEPLSGPASPSGLVRFCAKAMDSTYEKGAFTDDFALRISQEPISEQFRRWAEVWESQARNQLSAVGLPIGHVLAAPVGFRSPVDVGDFTLVACVFLAVDSSIEDEGRVIEVLRFLLMHLLEANATSWVLRKGDLLGRDAAMVSASHELSRVVDAIAPGASESAYALLRKYFKDLLRTPADGGASVEVAPSPQSLSLEKLVREKFLLASQVDAIVGIAKEGSAAVAALSPRAFDARIEAESQEIVTLLSTEQIEGSSISCSAEELAWFELAILASARNCIRHTRGATGAALRVRLSPQWGAECLEMVNCFTSFIPKRSAGVRPTGGTLKALFQYVRAYGKNPRLASITRQSVTETKGPGATPWYREEWRTVIPLPGNR